MEKSNLKIYYIYHSGFLVETEKHTLIFDYYKDGPAVPSLQTSNIISEDYLRKKENIIVFVSHSHGDHFNPVIFDWEKVNPNIKYILSSDVSHKTLPKNYYILSENDEISFSSISVKAYGSTDIGISFLVKMDGLQLFHAGDLNWWHWKEDPVQEQQEAESNFRLKVEQLVGNSIDIAFFPVDPRLEENYSLGGNYFIKKIKPKVFIPMHFGLEYKIIDKFISETSSNSTEIVKINDVRQRIFFNNNY